MSVIIRLQNLSLTASAMDIRVFFHGLSIPDGGVHIVGGKDGDAFIAFTSDEDARQAMNLSGQNLKDSPIKLLLSSRNEMFKVIEQARIGGSGGDEIDPSVSPQPLNHSISGDNGLNTSNNNIPFESSNNALNPNGNPLASMMPGFPGGLNVSNVAPGFENMKLTPQQLAQLAALQMQGLLSSQGINPAVLGQNPNPFMNIGLTPATATNNVSGPPPNPLGFPGFIPGIVPGMLNQQPPQQSASGGNNQQMGGGGINPFAQSGMRMTNFNPNPGFTNSINPNILQGGPQNVHNGNNGPGPIRPNNFGKDDFNRNIFHPNHNENPQRLRGNVLGPAFRPNVTSAFEMNRNQNVRPNIDRDRREREPVGDLNRAARIDRRRSDSVELKDPLRERERRRRSRSRERERSRREGRKSRSRSRSKDRSRGNVNDPRPARRNSARNDKLSTVADTDSRNISTNSDPEILIIDEKPAETACVMLTNISNDATYRDIREFLRAETRNYGIMRDFENNTACVRLDKPIEIDNVMRKSGRKLHGEVVQIERVPLGVFEDQTKKFGRNNPHPVEVRNQDRRDFGEREKDRERDFRFREREREPRDSSRDNGECCLIIHGLPVSFNGSDVANITLEGVNKSLYSDIHIHEEPIDRTGWQFATAFVKFHSFPEAERTIELIQRTQDEHLRARIGDIDELQKIRQGVLPQPTPPRLEAKPLFDLDVEMDSPNVMLKGTPFNMSERDVFDFFSDIGLSPKRVKLLTNSQNGSRINKIICEFEDIPQARRAVSKDGQSFGRSAISVRMLPRRDLNGPLPSIIPLRGGGRPGGFLGSRPPPPGAFNPQFLQNQPQTENPFVQALNHQSSAIMAPNDNPMRGGMRGGLRGRGGPPMGGRGRGGGPMRGRGGPPMGGRGRGGGMRPSHQHSY